MKYQVWMESYCGMESHCPVRMLAEVEANTFEEACKIIGPNYEGWDPLSMMIWECQLFNNEVEARKSLIA